MNKKGENMADFNITGAVTPKVDIAKWKKMTAQEIIREEGKGEEIPAEIIIWAQQMAAFAKIPDNVTYEQVDGDVGIEALEKLGLDENLVGLEQENAQQATKTEEPDAVKDPNKAENDETKLMTFSNIAITINHLIMLTIPILLMSLITSLIFKASDKLLK